MNTASSTRSLIARLVVHTLCVVIVSFAGMSLYAQGEGSGLGDNRFHTNEDSAAVMARMTTLLSSLVSSTRDQRNALFARWIDEEDPGNTSSSYYISFADFPSDLQSLLNNAQPGTIIGPVSASGAIHVIDIIDVRSNGKPYVRAQHILLKTRAQASKILQQLRAGGDFDQLAREQSIDRGSAARGGDLGYFRQGTMVKAFEKACFNAQPGQIFGPVKTEFGYHIIRVTERGSRSFKMNDWMLIPRASE